MLADVGAGTGLWGDNGTGAALFITDDAKLRRFDATWQVHVEHSAKLLQQLRHKHYKMYNKSKKVKQMV